MEHFPLKEETYRIIGICMDIHNTLGAGFFEIVYKDALELEFRKAEILYEREKEYSVNYKGTILPHKFYADFVVFDKKITPWHSLFEPDLCLGVHVRRQGGNVAQQ